MLSWGRRHRPAAPSGLKSGSARLKKLFLVVCESYVWIVCRRFACLRPLPSGLRISRKGPVAAMLGSCSRHFFQKVFSPTTMTVFEAILGPCWTHHEAHLNRFGVEELTLETLSPVASKVALLSLQSILSPKLCSCGAHLGVMLGLCCHILAPFWTMLGPSWGYVGPSGVYVGAMFAHLGVMLWLCCHILASCWTMLWAMLDRRAPPRWFWAMLFSWLYLHSRNFAWKNSPQWPARHPLHFCNTISLKKLNPAGDGQTPDERLKAPTSGLRGSRKRFPRVGRKVGGLGRLPGSWSYNSGYHIASAARHGRTAWPDCMGFAQHRPCRDKKWTEKGIRELFLLALFIFEAFFWESFCIFVEGCFW